MFHQGNLQSGIARAIQEQKLVGCFIRGIAHHARVSAEADMSRRWSREYHMGGRVVEERLGECNLSRMMKIRELT
jgi:hypothetical protein